MKVGFKFCYLKKTSNGLLFKFLNNRFDRRLVLGCVYTWASLFEGFNDLRDVLFQLMNSTVEVELGDALVGLNEEL